MRIPSGVTDQVVNFVAVDSTDFTTRETGLSSFTVYRSRNGGTATAMTTPTVSELDATNMPGVYTLLLDEDMTIGSGNDSEAMVFHITQASMAPVTIEIELYRPKITAGETLTSSSGAATIGTNNDKTGYSISGTKTTLDALNDISTSDVNTEVDNAFNTAIPGSPTANSINERIAAIDDLTQASGDGDLAAILVDTGVSLPSSLATAYSLVGDVYVDTHTTLPAQISGLNDPSAADIRTEIDSNSTQLAAIKAKTDNLPGGVAKNVALSNFPFYMVDATDLSTPETSLSVTATISKDGGSFSACTNSASEVGNGMYVIDLTQTEMNADVIILRFTATGAADRVISLVTDA